MKTEKSQVFFLAFGWVKGTRDWAGVRTPRRSWVYELLGSFTSPLWHLVATWQCKIFYLWSLMKGLTCSPSISVSWKILCFLTTVPQCSKESHWVQKQRKSLHVSPHKNEFCVRFWCGEESEEIYAMFQQKYLFQTHL